MNKEKLDLINTYIKAGITNILLEDVDANVIKNAVILESNCDIKDLNGHYEGLDFLPPNWYKELISKDSKNPILIINNLNKIKTEEQRKFIEILKYNKISTFDLPKNCIVIMITNNLLQNPINEEVYSLLAHI
ncbi:MAG: hypothetical protein NC181_01410 [Clostridium sp.]|nr:hypothetical protein [Clostridium sp.]MCM1443966.1 hypothetical protein [Candidatus Amulumruptor caecigallinarius]